MVDPSVKAYFINYISSSFLENLKNQLKVEIIKENKFSQNHYIQCLKNMTISRDEEKDKALTNFLRNPKI
jgi:hypothetical protein